MVVADISAEATDDVAHAIVAAGGQAIAVPGDVSKAEFAEHVVTEAVKAYGGLDCAFRMPASSMRVTTHGTKGRSDGTSTSI